jgi:hypothetical protein
MGRTWTPEKGGKWYYNAAVAAAKRDSWGSTAAIAISLLVVDVVVEAYFFGLIVALLVCSP